MFSLICAWIHGWVNNREAGDLSRHRTYYNVIVMWNQWTPFRAISFSVWLSNTRREGSSDELGWDISCALKPTFSKQQIRRWNWTNDIDQITMRRVVRNWHYELSTHGKNFKHRLITLSAHKMSAKPRFVSLFICLNCNICIGRRPKMHNNDIFMICCCCWSKIKFWTF